MQLLFFVDGPRGIGKTYLYSAIPAIIRSKNLIALATTSSRVVVAILLGGRNAHSRFEFPFEIENNISCNVSKQSSLSKLLQLMKIMPMINKHTTEVLDNMLQDINEYNLPFGGKVIVLGGYFRPVLPVIPRERKDEIINASLAKSYL